MSRLTGGKVSCVLADYWLINEVDQRLIPDEILIESLLLYSGFKFPLMVNLLTIKCIVKVILKMKIVIHTMHTVS